MFVAVQLPFTDVRCFLSTPTGRLGMPAFPIPQPGRDFIRGFGQVRRRRRGGIQDWTGEDVYCDVAGAIRFRNAAASRQAGISIAPIVPRCVFRRFLSDGSAVSRIEFGFSNNDRVRQIQSLKGNECLSLVESCISLPVKVQPPKQGPVITTLLESRRSLAGHYLRKTTEREFERTNTLPSWWFSEGTPAVLVEHYPGEISTLPKLVHSPSIPITGAPHLAHTWVEYRGARISVWYLGNDEASDPVVVRRLRMHLFRIHAERESVKQVLRLIARRQIPVTRGSRESDRLQEYLHNAIQVLSQQSRFGIPQSDILKAASEVTDLVSEGERMNLLNELSRIRKNILRNVERFSGTKSIESRAVYVIGENNTIAIGHDNKIGGQTMTKYEVKFGDHTNFTGNLVVAETIKNSLNTVAASAASVEMKEKLTELSKAVLVMCERLPKEKAEEAARDLKALSEEVTSANPRPKWYQLSADGLMEAAKTVAEISGPVISTVKAILGLL